MRIFWNYISIINTCILQTKILYVTKDHIVITGFSSIIKRQYVIYNLHTNRLGILFYNTQLVKQKRLSYFMHHEMHFLIYRNFHYQKCPSFTS